MYNGQPLNFLDAAEATNEGDRGLSAFTKSQNMDIDTQTNFNIIEYESKTRSFFEQNSIEESILTSMEHNNCTCKPHYATKSVHFKEPSTQRKLNSQTKTSSMFRRDVEHNESKEWLQLASEIIASSESNYDEDGRQVSIPVNILEKNRGLANMELDQSKISEIKQAMLDY